MPTMKAPSSKMPVNRPPVAPGQPINSSMYQESFDLLSASHDYSEQYQPMAMPRYTISSNGKDFKFIKTPNNSSGFTPMPTRTAISKNLQNDSKAVTSFGHHPAKSHDSFDLTDVGYDDARTIKPSMMYPMRTKQSLKMQRLKETSEEDWQLPSESKSPCTRPLCCAFLLIFCILFILGVVLGAIYLAVRPKPPTLEMQNLNVTRYKYDQAVSGGASHVLAGMTFVVIASNPNKHADLFYDNVDIDLKYEDFTLGSFLFPGFKQRQENETNFVAELPDTLATLQDPVTSVKMQQDVSISNVQLDLRGHVAGHYKVWGIRLKNFNIPVDCKLNVKPESGDGPSTLMFNSCYQYLT